MRITLLLFCVLTASGLRAEVNDALLEPTSPPGVLSAIRPVPGGGKLWQLSLVSVAAANALDIHSSWGKRELNGTLATKQGTFGGQSVAIKLALQGGMVGVQYLFLRGRPHRTLNRVMAIMNFGAASTLTATAVRNYAIPRPPR